MAAPPMPLEAIGPVVTVGSVRAVAALALALLRLLRLAAGNERWKTVHVLFALRLHVLRALVVLLVVIVLLIILVVLTVWIVLLLLLVLLRINRLLLTRGERLTDLRLVVAVVITIIRAIATGAGLPLRLLLVVGLALAELLLCRSDQTKIMFGMLIVILGRNRVAGTLRIAGELQILFGDVGCCSANFHVRSIGLVHT